MIDLLSFVPKTNNKVINKIESIYFILSLFVSSYFFITFQSIPVKYYCYWLEISCLIEVVLVRKLYVDIRELLLFFGMLSFFLIGEVDADIWSYMIIFMLSYEYVKLFTVNVKSKAEKRIITIFLIMALCFCVLNGLHFLNYRPLDGFRITFWKNIWTGKPVLCTQYMFLALPICGLLFWSIVTIGEHITLSAIVIAGVIYSNYIFLVTYTRTVILASVLTLIFCIFICWWKNRKKRSATRLASIGAVITGIVIIICVLSFVLNVGNIQGRFNLDMIKYTLSRNGGILGNVRFKAQLQVLTELPKYPMGHNPNLPAGLNHAHNFWLDIARISGIIPFIIMVVFSVISCIDVIKLAISKTRCGLNYFLSSIFLMLFFDYMTEGILWGEAYLFWGIGCMLMGAVRGYHIHERLQTNSKKKKRKKGKIKNAPVALVIMMSLVISICGCGKAEETVVSEDDIGEYVDDAEYDDIALMGEGTKENPYLINDYNDLIYFYNSVNTGWLFEDKYILQTNDIDMSEHPFWPIAEYSTGYTFLGTYDGGGHVIQNVCMYVEGYSAIFGRLGGTIINLGIIDGYIEGWRAAGLVGICTSHDAKILNCYVKTTLKGKYVSGITDSASGDILGCVVQCSLDGSDQVERFVTDGDGIVDRCYFLEGVYNPDTYIFTDEKLFDRYGSSDAFPGEELVNELNQYTYDMAIVSDMESDDFCKWEVTPDGQSVRLSTKRMNSTGMPNSLIISGNINNAFWYASIIIGCGISVLVMLTTLRMDRRKNKKSL